MKADGSALLSLEVGDDVLYTPIPEGVILLDLKNQQFYQLDDVGGRVWYLFMQHGNFQAVADQLHKEYGGEPGIFRDVEAITRDLCDSGLLKRSSCQLSTEENNEQTR